MKSAKVLFLANRVLCSPLEALFTLFIFIISKNLDATPIQLTIIACIKPVSAFFSFYITSAIFDNHQGIRKYLIANNMFGCILCFLYPYVENVWFFVVSYAFFMVTRKAAYPAWLELLKNKLEFNSMSRVISQGNSIFYFISMLFPPLICFWMDIDEQIWRIIFIGLSVLQMLNTVLILLIETSTMQNRSAETISLTRILEPLKQGWKVLAARPDFKHYQVLYFLGGTGIVAFQPILPIYFKENLHLSYTQLGLAFSFCKGISFILTSPYWSRWLNHVSIYRLNSVINFLICVHIAFLFASNFGTEWLYLAYIFYGTMQAGSELSWGISGPIFSGQKESSIYSGINLAVVGIRGCICPFLGHMLYVMTGASGVFVVAFGICFVGAFYGLWLDKVKVKLHQAI